MKHSATLSVPHAILFVRDPTNPDSGVPEYVHGQLTSAIPSCVSACTQAYVDGKVQVRLGTRLTAKDTKGCNFTVEHSLETPGRCVAVVTSAQVTILEVTVSGVRTKLTIYADHPESPGLVCIEATE